MLSVKIGGVPEHFNYPWVEGIKNCLFASEDYFLEWLNYPGGTGAMISALKNDELDMALLLTEGAVKAISEGNEFKILTNYVESPLIWGIHASGKTKHEHDLASTRFAISRYGSGSHLMSYLYADKYGITLSDNQMVVVGDLAGARSALAEGKADLFLWEKFMTKPLVDVGEFYLHDEYPSPWPCFVLVVNNSFYDEHIDIIEHLLESLLQALEVTKNQTELALKISEKYLLHLSDVKTWLSKTKWIGNFNVDTDSLKNVIDALFKLNLIKNKPQVDSLYFDKK